MTAASVIGRAFAFAAPVPFLTASFPHSVLAFWFVVMTFQSFVAAVNGTLPTIFTNMVSYANVGSSSLGSLKAHDIEDAQQGAPNWPLIQRICHTLEHVFLVLAGAWILLTITLGSLAIWRPLQMTGMFVEPWLVWGIFVCGAALRIALQSYSTFLLGRGLVSSVRRIEALSWLASGSGACLVLSILPDIVLAMGMLQIPFLVNFIVLRRLAIKNGWAPQAAPTVELGNVSILGEIIPRAWRGSVGVVASNGAVYGSGLLYAQVGDSATVSAYLFALTIAGIVGQVTTSPFSAQLPLLARLLAQGDMVRQRQIAELGIARSLWLYVLGMVAVPVGVDLVNRILPHPLIFTEISLWSMLAGATFLMRYGSMHMQLFTVTNDIRWHIVDSVNAALFFGFLLLTPLDNIYLFPMCQAAALMLFYVPYVRMLTWKYFDIPLLADIRGALVPAVTMAALLWGAFKSGI